MKVYDSLCSQLKGWKVKGKCIEPLDEITEQCMKDDCPDSEYCNGTGIILRDLKPEDLDWEKMKIVQYGRKDKEPIFVFQIPAVTNNNEKIIKSVCDCCHDKKKLITYDGGNSYFIPCPICSRSRARG
jgi:hypothetical protein